MTNFSKLSDYRIHKIWTLNVFDSLKEVHDFRKELVKRGFVSWDEINTKFECKPTINQISNDLFLEICYAFKIDKLCKWLNDILEKI
ncbi:MAG: hypothetical protein M0R03_20845 [Novosphingobium sp.]|nr:hypothetical protein [Novosphingobium sp.]